jgi:hypothetical protein
MAKRSDIFAKARLTPGQLRAAAERRLADARCLVDSGNQQRANGAMYLAGFAIECLLKALLLERYPNLRASVDPATLSKRDREVFALLYRHELDAMLGFLPELEPKLMAVSAWTAFKNICAEWTIYARYSPKQESLGRAREYLAAIEEAKIWLKAL